MTHTSGPSKPKTISSALRHQYRYVIQFKIIIIILITTFHSVCVTNKPQSVSNAAYNIPDTHCSYSATGIRNLATQHTWLDCFFGFVSLAVQRLPKFFIPTFQVPRFPVARYLLPRYISVTSTLNIALIWPPETRAVRRRRRQHVGLAPAPLLWRVNVMWLDFCNAVNNEALKFTKIVRTMRECFAIALDTQMKHGSVKAKCFRGQFCENDSWYYKFRMELFFYKIWF